ncbi:MAG TPA: CBS domain-containing protein [Phycisphaerales bacterium]|nr:CBS domain-containing protein [Phycisphaerales bacterium]
MPKVRDVMSSPVKTIQLTAQVNDIIDFFKLNQISGAPVVNDKGFAVGLISRTNLVSGTDFEGKTARDIMTPFVFEITPDKDVLDVAKSMADANIRRVIVTENEVPVGVVTALDVVKEYIKLRES